MNVLLLLLSACARCPDLNDSPCPDRGRGAYLECDDCGRAWDCEPDVGWGYSDVSCDCIDSKGNQITDTLDCPVAE
jgi:hypothetical protein